MTEQVYLFEGQAYDPATSSIKVVQFAKGLLTEGDFTDRPEPYPLRLVQGFYHEASIFENNLPGSSMVSVGSTTINNTDGRFDYLLDYNWDSRPVVIKKGVRGAAYSTYVTEFIGSVVEIVADQSNLVFTLRDNTFKLLKDIQVNKYTGGGGKEGVPDIRSRRKPLLFGFARNIAPVWVDPVQLIAQIHDGAIASVAGVYDRANPLTFQENYATYALLAAATISPGMYATCLAEGFIRLGAPPAGALTLDATGAHSTATNIPALLKAVLLAQGGLVIGDLNDASFTQAAADIPHGYEGLYYQDPEFQLQELVETLISSVSGYWYANRQGLITIGKFQFRAPVASIRAEDLMSLGRLASPPPIHRVKVSYGKNNTVLGPSEFSIPRQTLNGFLERKFIYVDTSTAWPGPVPGGTYKVFLNDTQINDLAEVQFAIRDHQPWISIDPLGVITITDPGAAVATAVVRVNLGEFRMEETITVVKDAVAPLQDITLAFSADRFIFNEQGEPVPENQNVTVTPTGLNTTAPITLTSVDNIGTAVPITAGVIDVNDLSSSPLAFWLEVTATDANGVKQARRLSIQRGVSGFAAASLSAIATVDGKVVFFYEPTAPTEGMEIDDVWIDIDDANKMYRWDGTSWVWISDTRIIDALTAAAGAQATADGKVTTYFSSTAPLDDPPGTLALGDLWYNEDTGLVLRWDGMAWSQNFATRNVHRGAWAPNTLYLVSDTFTYEGTLYRVLVEHTSSVAQPPPNANVEHVTALTLEELDAIAAAELAAAIAALESAASDNVLTAAEKRDVISPLHARLEIQYQQLVAQAAEFQMSTAAATAARQAWEDLLASYSPAWNDFTQETDIYTHFFADQEFPAGWTLNSAIATPLLPYSSLTDSSATVYGYARRNKAQPAAATKYSWGASVRKDSIPATTRVALLRLQVSGGTGVQSFNVMFDTSTGQIGTPSSAPSESGSLDLGDEWFIWGTATTAADKTTVGIDFYPAVGKTLTAYDVSATGTIYTRPPLITLGDWKKLGKGMLLGRMVDFVKKMEALAGEIRGVGITVQWSSDGLNTAGNAASLWHEGYVAGQDFYMRQSYDNGVTWTVAIRAVGEDGTSVVSGYLTNEAHIVATEADGTGALYTDTLGNFRVWNGSTDVTGNGVAYSIPGGVDNGVSWSQTKNGLTLTLNKSSGNYTLGGASWTSDSESFTLQAVHSSSTVTKVYTLTKSKKGEKGESAQLIVLGSSHSFFNVDSGGAVKSRTISFSAQRQGTASTTVWTIYDHTGAERPITGYLTNIVGDTAQLTHTAYASFLATYGGEFLTVRAALSGTPALFDSKSIVKVSDGYNGLNVALVWLFRRSATALLDADRPTVASTFTYSTGILTGQDNGWTQKIPAGDNPLYAITAMASSYDPTDSIPATEWATPSLTGSSGSSSARVQIYRRSVTQPIRPANPADYTFATGVLVLNAADSAWSQTIPAGNDPLWSSMAPAVGFNRATTDTIAAAEWTEPVIIVQNGNYSSFVYKRSAAQPATPTSTTGPVPSGVAPNDNWFDAPPAPDGNPLWMSKGEMTSYDILVGSWTVPRQVEGDEGAPGKTLYLISDRQLITYNAADVVTPSPQDTILTVQALNLETTTFTLSMKDAAGNPINANTRLTLPSVGTFTASGNNITWAGATGTPTFRLTSANFHAVKGTSNGVIVTVTHANGLSDSLSIMKAPQGDTGGPGPTGPAGPTISITADPGTHFTTFNGLSFPAAQTNTFTAVLSGITGTISWSMVPSIKSSTGPTFSLTSQEMGQKEQVVVKAACAGVTAEVIVTKAPITQELPVEPYEPIASVGEDLPYPERHGYGTDRAISTGHPGWTLR